MPSKSSSTKRAPGGKGDFADITKSNDDPESAPLANTDRSQEELKTTVESRPEHFPGKRRNALNSSRKKLSMDSSQQLQMDEAKRQRKAFGVRSQQQMRAMGKFEMINQGEVKKDE